MPSSRSLWKLVILISIGGWFEIYDLFFTAYIAPGLIRSGILTTHGTQFFGFEGIGAFIAATFAGLFTGTFFLGFLADRYGRKPVFLGALAWYATATFIMAFQSDATGLLLWRYVAAVGVGVQAVTMDTYISEVVPHRMRGRAFALNHAVIFSAVPAVALISWLLVPHDPLGVAGWRWIVLIGAVGGGAVWFVRKHIPESPLWLAQQGRSAEALQVIEVLEQDARRNGAVLEKLQDPRPVVISQSEPPAVVPISAVFRKPIRRTLFALIVFNLCLPIGLYGFANWVPTLLVAKGITITNSLFYSFIIAFAYPLAPLLGLRYADKLERKTVIVCAALAVGVIGIAFSQVTVPVLLVMCGVLLTLANMTMTFTLHAYQVEVFPTAIRARAAGLAYSASRLSGIFCGFLIAYVLHHNGVIGVFAVVSSAMLIGAASIGFFGPRLGKSNH